MYVSLYLLHKEFHAVITIIWNGLKLLFKLIFVSVRVLRITNSDELVSVFSDLRF